jgi:hypothetical protein
MQDYYRAWVDGIISAGFRAGVYCPFSLARQLRGIDGRPVFWSVRPGQYPGGSAASYSNPLPAPEPLLSSIEFTTLWQLSLDVGVLRLSPTQTVPKIDFDSSSVPDPSAVS